MRFRKELPTGTVIRLYYPDENGSYDEPFTQVIESSGGQLEYLLSAPGKEYSSFRLAVSRDYQLDDVLVSPTPIVSEVHVIPRFRLRDLLVIFLITLALVELVFYRWPKIKWFFTRLFGARRAWGRAVLKSLGTGLACALLAWPVCHLRGIPYWRPHVLFFFILGALACCLWHIQHWAAEYPQRIFAILCLGLGLMIISAAPLTAYVTEDKGFHFENALTLSYAGNVTVTRSDKALMNLQAFPSSYGNLEDNQFFLEDMRNSFLNGGRYAYEENVLRPSYLGYLPGAAGLWFGRFLGLPFTWNVVLGRFTNLLAYTLLMACAIRLARRGRALLCVVGLIPTALFQATAFSYLSAVMGVAAIAAVLFLNEASRPDVPITRNRALLILGLFLLAFLPKPVYFPLLFMLFFLPRSKFESSAQHRRWLLLPALSIVILLTALAVSFLTGNSAATDPRGGPSATAVEQVKNVFRNPVTCAKLFLEYILIEVLDPTYTGRVLTEMGTFTHTAVRIPSAIFVLALLALVILTEPGDQPLNGPGRTILWTRTGTALGVCSTIGALVMWCYVVFTPLGTPSGILGFQGRYLLPLLFPALFILRSGKLNSTYHKAAYLYAVLCPLTLLICIGMWMILRCYW